MLSDGFGGNTGVGSQYAWMCVWSPGIGFALYDVVTRSCSTNVMRFSFVFGWCTVAHGAPGEHAKSPLPGPPGDAYGVASQPAQYRFHAGSAGSSISSIVKSLGDELATSVAPVLNCASEPSPAAPLAALPGTRQVEFS